MLGYSAQGEDGDSGGCLAGCLELFQSNGWGKFKSLNDFAEDWPEEDAICAHARGSLDVLQRVAGDADVRGRGGNGLIDLADLPGGEFARSGGKVHAIGSGGQRDVDSAVHQYPSAPRPDGREDLAHQLDQFSGMKVFLSYLKEVDAFCGPPGGLMDYRSQPILFRTAVLGSSCNRIALHFSSVGPEQSVQRGAV